jgi:hypothetical protein
MESNITVGSRSGHGRVTASALHVDKGRGESVHVSRVIVNQCPQHVFFVIFYFFKHHQQSKPRKMAEEKMKASPTTTPSTTAAAGDLRPVSTHSIIFYVP